ncbi:MAG: phosphatidate cytidylyltransferase [Desulfitobacteriaceae bacterium]|nr:phosphatidate cytidylyltransferase [Desulfitobacteriaceae bacterium]MDI6880190.1 phosphatidate cytidylyltransferase [Desulfitobacteriaceae bacterium]MDI6914543.1 phosphatidate cytidylyltransferase [Desulfitobacteriaceae bacterium]
MLTRTISAIIGGSLLLGLTYLGEAYVLVLVLTIALIGLHEYMQILERLGQKAWYTTNMLAAVTWLGGVFLIGERSLQIGFVVWLLVAASHFALFYPQISLTQVLYNFWGVVYTAGLLSYFFLLRELPLGLKWTFSVFFLVWAVDSGAYLIGRGFGKHPLAPEVSPKKTIEGSLGGLALTLVVTWFLGSWLGEVVPQKMLLLGLLVGVSAQVGDLFESALKRAAGVKDSGRLIPGHGGMLDRFDSFVFALPLVYYFVRYLE